jgi:translocation and assembly module TamB
MVRSGLKYAALTFLLLGFVVIGGGAWLVGTDSGARALLDGVTRWSSVKIEVDSVSGRLVDELRLDGMRLRWTGGEVEIPSLLLRWQPRQLFRWEFTVEELSLGEVIIRLPPGPAMAAQKEDAPPLRWPLVSGLPRRLHGSIASLRIAGVVIHSAAAEAQHLGPVSGRLDWQDGILHFSNLQARTPYGALTGEVSAGLVTPSLALRLHGEEFDDTTGLEKVDLNLNLGVGKDGEFLSGPLALDLHTMKQGSVRLNGELALAAEAVELREFLLSRSTAAGEVRGRIHYRRDGGLSPFLLQLQLAGLDLAPEIGIATALSGSLDLAGGTDAYTGQFDLNNRGADWRDLRLAGRLAGDRQQLSLTDLDSRLLAGQLGGDLNLNWSGPLALSATLQGKNLNPGVLSPPLSGQINFDLTGTLLLPPDAPPQLELMGQLHDSILRGHPLTGVVDARMDEGDLLLRHLELHGDGIDLTATGRLQKRVDFTVAIERVEEFFPDAAGEGSAVGWLRWQDDELTGVISGEGTALAYAGLTIDRGTLSLQHQTPKSPISLHADLNTIRYQNRHFNRLELQGDGLLTEHQLRIALTWPQGQVRVEGAGGYQSGSWSGTILQMAGEDQEQGGWRMAAPVTLLAGGDSLRFSPLELSSERGERIEIAGAYDRSTGAGEVIAQWEDLALNRANPWLTDLRLTGASSGTVEGRWSDDGTLRLQGKVVAAGRLEQGDLALEAQRLAVDLSWGEQGLLAHGNLDLALGGTLSAKLTSTEKGRLTLPKRLTLQLDWDALGPELFAPWMPPTLNVAGKLSGGVKAEIFPDGALDVTGNADIDDGILNWEQTKGRISVAVRSAEVNWRWREKALVLDLSLVLADYGRIAGSASLPIPAVLPITIAPTGELWGEVEGNFKEQGLLSALLPGVLRESHGNVKLDLKLGGSWQTPTFAGDLSVTGAGAYIPQAGIEVRDLSLQSRFDADKLHIRALELSSGDGKIKGEGELRLQNWQVAEFSGKFGGERFLTIDLPELRLVTSPALTVSGTAQTIKVRGEIKIPELLVRGRQSKAPLRQHADVLIVDAPPAEGRERPLDLDLEVRVILGDRVMVDFGGIDASLGGDVIVTSYGNEAVSGRGKINVIKGAYAAYGMKLDISRGSLLFAGGPIDQPTLDILALRSAGEVQAGVRVGGTPRLPTVTLYSEPSMPDTDILSYIVLGRPMGSDAGQADLLMVAAGALLAKGESTVLQDRLRRRVGLDVIDIQAGNGDLTTSVITVGKYLNPKLYISLGHSLFTGSNVVGLRYDISEHWQAESTVGEESGVDLFYKIEFN